LSGSCGEWFVSEKGVFRPDMLNKKPAPVQQSDPRGL
jgi:hypothetical protein